MNEEGGMKIEIKLCKDCKHAKRDLLLGYRYAKCQAAPKAPAPYMLTTGEGVKGGFFYCETERTFTCGIVGRNFEPKPRPWWAFWRKA
jgi:hypothetical protein